MAKMKTQETGASVAAFLDAVAHDQRRRDCSIVTEIMGRITGCEARMWGPSMVGFGRYHYKYASGREGDWFLTGFSPRKHSLTLYIMPGFADYGDLMSRLGKYKTGKSCLYINKLDDVDLAILEDLIRLSVAFMKRKY